jgi:hypothetical protein
LLERGARAFARTKHTGERPSFCPGFDLIEKMNRTQRNLALFRLLAAHFAPARLQDLIVTRRDFPHWMRPDLQKALEALFAAMPRCQFFGARLRGDLGMRFADLVEPGPEAAAIGPAEYQDTDIGEAQPVRCLTRGLWTAETEGVRFALLLEVNEGYRAPRARVEIAVPQGEAATRIAARVIEHLRAQAERGDSWRGKILMLDRAHDDFELSAAGLRVVKADSVRRDQIVLPERTLALIERNTLGFARQSECLARLGLSARKGVLLYGPPGTGKTLVARWLTGALEGFTKVVVTAEHYGLLSESLAIARALEPALVVLEDVDLVGGHRDGPWAASGGVLNALLNEMDGIAPETRVLFVLTTNRPEVLEPALAMRPGRVDQAIEVGLPGESERRLLVKRYSGGLQVENALAEDTARRVGRVSPAFIKELMRRAAQAMLERGGENALESGDVNRAIDDMLGAGGRLGAQMLGAGKGIGFAPVA